MSTVDNLFWFSVNLNFKFYRVQLENRGAYCNFLVKLMIHSYLKYENFHFVIFNFYITQFGNYLNRVS